MGEFFTLLALISVYILGRFPFVGECCLYIYLRTCQYYSFFDFFLPRLPKHHCQLNYKMWPAKLRDSF